MQSVTPGQVVTWDTSQLTVDGSVRVMSVTTAPVTITPVVNGLNLTLTWPSDQTGWTLETQTNSATVGISANWVPVAGSTETTVVTVLIDPAIDATFFRLAL